MDVQNPPSAMAPKPAPPTSYWPALAGTINSLVGFSLLLAFVVGASRYRLWHSNRFLNGYLAVMSSPVYLLFNQFLLLTLKNPDFGALDIASAVLLYVVFSSYISTTGYALDRRDRWEEVKKQEQAHVILSFTLLWLILVVISKDNENDEKTDVVFVCFTLLFIWLLSLFKIFHRVISVLDANSRYGLENTNIVAMHMAKRHIVRGADVDDVDDKGDADKEGCGLIVAGEQYVKVDTNGEITLNRIASIDHVWSCRGWALRDGDADLCLSFAMFKLFKRWIHGCPMAEAGDDKMRRFALDYLLSDGGERSFHLMAMEAKFLLDLFYTKHSITFGPWMILINIFILAMTAFCIFLAVRMREIFRDLKSAGEIEINPHKFLLAEIAFGFVILVELTAFFRYVLSDWSKAILLAKYSKWRQRKPSAGSTTALDCLIQWVCTRPHPRTFFVSIPQYTLLHNAATSACCSWLACILSCGCLKRAKEGKKVDRWIPLSMPVKDSVVVALKRLLSEDSPQLSNGSAALERHGLKHQLGWACNLKLHDRVSELYQTAMVPIMVWHVATTFCAMADEFVDVPQDQHDGLVNAMADE